MNRGLVALWLIALLSSACGSPGAEIMAEIDGEVTSKGTSAKVALFADDFSLPDSGWNVQESDNYVTAYADGEMRVFANNDASAYGFQVAYLEQSFGDARIEVDARRVSGSDAASIYLICRRVDGDHYIFGDIDFEGDARIGAFLQDEQQIFADIEGVFVLHEGSNQLRLDCIGNQVAFYANGRLIANVQVDGPAMGGVGFSAGGAGEGQNDFRFDNFAVYAP